MKPPKSLNQVSKMRLKSLSWSHMVFYSLDRDPFGLFKLQIYCIFSITEIYFGNFWTFLRPILLVGLILTCLNRTQQVSTSLINWHNFGLAWSRLVASSYELSMGELPCTSMLFEWVPKKLRRSFSFSFFISR